MDAREAALAKFFECLQTIDTVPTVKRLLNYSLGREQLPAIVQVDGRDIPDTHETGLYWVSTEVEVDLVLLGSDEDLEGLPTQLNDYVAQIKSAVYAKPTLDATCIQVLWTGTDPPTTLSDPNNFTAVATTVSFTIERQEADFDPQRVG